MSTEKQEVSKVTFDQSGDFKFKVAYDAYSNLFDTISNIEARSTLNALISDLFKKEISYHQFYSEINHYRGETERGRRFPRTKIQGTKKREYRRDEQKKQRIKRHKR